MSGFISVRVTREERKKLLALKAERECRTLSQAVRLLCGFPRGMDEAFDGSEDQNSVETLIRTVLRMIERLDTNNKLLFHLSDEVGQLAGKPRVRHKDLQINELVKPPDAPAEDHRRHPALPEGFAR